MRVSALMFAAAVLPALSVATQVQERLDVFVASREHPAIGYSRDTGSNPAASLDEHLLAGSRTLRFEQGSGYLRATLDALGVPVESQMLVFSETSAQADRIGLTNPRALYFSDDVAVGWVRGADALEIVTHDARQGAMFYTLEQRASTPPRLVRQNSCLLCHQTWDTLGVPGFQVLSTFAMSDDPHAYASGVVMDHRTPFAQRWSGWYVTRKIGSIPHLGNLPVIVPARELQQGRRPTLQLESVRGRFDLTGYPTACSDIVALSVMTHQAHASNLITRLGWEARVAAADAGVQESAGAVSGPTDAAVGATVPAGPTSPRVVAAAHDLAEYLVFSDEAPLTTPIEGGCGFAETFTARGPRDSRGRSLRDFDLRTRLFRYPVSYMVYAPAFDALAPEARALVYRELLARLRTPPVDRGAAVADGPSRQAAVEILRATKRELPDWFN